MADRGCEFSFFQCIHARIDIRTDISISIRPMITKFGEQLHLQDLTQVKVIKQELVTLLRQNYVTSLDHYISTTTVSLATKLSRMVPYSDRLVPIKWHDPLIMWYCEITWQTKGNIFLLSECLWLQNLGGWSPTLMGSSL